MTQTHSLLVILNASEVLWHLYTHVTEHSPPQVSTQQHVHITQLTDGRSAILSAGERMFLVIFIAIQQDQVLVVYLHTTVTQVTIPLIGGIVVSVVLRALADLTSIARDLQQRQGSSKPHPKTQGYMAKTSIRMHKVNLDMHVMGRLFASKLVINKSSAAVR